MSAASGEHTLIIHLTPMNHPTILGIDPGTREMGIAVIQGPRLLWYGVHTLRNGTRPHDVIGQAKRFVLADIARYAPSILAVEKPYAIATKRAAVLSVIEQEVIARATELQLRVVELSPEEIRTRVTGRPRANKEVVAHALVEQGFDVLRTLLPQSPRRPAIGWSERDRYWLHMFDALAAAVAVGASLDRRVRTTHRLNDRLTA